MKLLDRIGLAVLMMCSLSSAAQHDTTPEQLVRWMRAVNTLEFEYKSANHRFATTDELFSFAANGNRTQSASVVQELKPAFIAPYVLQITTSGSNYSAVIKRPSDMHEKSTWCRTAVFSDDSGLIYLGQNIGCSGVASLGLSSAPSE